MLAFRSKGERVKFIRIAVGIVILAVVVDAFLPDAKSAPERVIRIGFQKYGNLVVLKGKGGLDDRLGPLGLRVEWKEFPSGPPLLEALNAGVIDFGHAGETPPIFAQAAGIPFVYAAYEPPAPKGEAILVAPGSPLRTVADLRGKKIALNKGSNVHYLLVRALESAGIKYSEIEPIYLAPADARAAFERGAVDAWVIWDPFRAAAEASTGARALVEGTGLVPNRQFYLARHSFADTNPAAVEATLAAVSDLDKWANGKEAAIAGELSAAIGLPAPVLEVALKRQTYGLRPIDGEAIADQQSIADTFYTVGLLPKQVVVASAVWNRAR